MKMDKVILFHSNWFGTLAIDVFVSKKLKNKYSSLKDDLYEVDCVVAKEFYERFAKHYNLVLIGSEDLAGKDYVMDLILELVKKGFKPLIYDRFTSNVYEVTIKGYEDICHLMDVTMTLHKLHELLCSNWRWLL